MHLRLFLLLRLLVVDVEEFDETAMADRAREAVVLDGHLSIARVAIAH